MFKILNLVLIAVLSALVSSVWGSYDSGPGYGASDQSFAAAPVTHGQGWSGGGHGGHNAGSYYHYHVPLVGQQQQQPHYHPQPQQNDHHHLYLLLPLLLLAALPLLLAPLLPLLLLPLGLSLLALLLPLIMMGGMMMMMMMPGGMMMMMMRNSDHPTRHQYHGDARSIGSYLYDDVSDLFGRYARSLDLDHCPERLACEAGSFIFPLKTDDSGAKFFVNYLVEKAVPKGRARRMIRSYEKAFWAGTTTGNCIQHKCQPTFNLARATTASSASGSESRNSTTSTGGKSSGGHVGKMTEGNNKGQGGIGAKSSTATPSVFYQYPTQSSYKRAGSQGYPKKSDSTLYVVRHGQNGQKNSNSSTFS